MLATWLRCYDWAQQRDLNSLRLYPLLCNEEGRCTHESGGCSVSCHVLLAGLSEKPVMSLRFTAAVTAVAFAPPCVGLEEDLTLQRDDHLAVGLESGEVQILSVEAGLSPADVGSSAAEPTALAAQDQPTIPPSPSSRCWAHQLLWQAPAHARHTGAIRRLRWRTVGPGHWQLASCSDDHAVRTYDILIAT